MRRFLFLVGILAAALAGAAEPVASSTATVPEQSQPRVSNRLPKPTEIGYRPADGTTAYFNPPSLTWLSEPGAQTYTVEWSADANFSNAATAERLPFNTYTHHAPLAPGRYF